MISDSYCSGCRYGYQFYLLIINGMHYSFLFIFVSKRENELNLRNLNVFDVLFYG